MTILDKVKLNHNGRRLADMRRQGAALASRHEIETVLGISHGEDTGTTSTMQWFLETPAGRVMICDKWSEPEGHWGIYAADEQAAMYAIEWLTAHKIAADMEGFHHE